MEENKRIEQTFLTFVKWTTLLKQKRIIFAVVLALSFLEPDPSQKLIRVQQEDGSTQRIVKVSDMHWRESSKGLGWEADVIHGSILSPRVMIEEPSGSKHDNRFDFLYKKETDIIITFIPSDEGAVQAIERYERTNGKKWIHWFFHSFISGIRFYSPI